ncbi:YbjN domain-containing protein [Streptomyces sp. ST2-7A]|uniref:YbjN domain-containing protein n=1 Tax=Streptomyces sp. ST2-7A TaxID=2907214 RepID=UPI001F3D9E85|nr:YbjN domain-containing protein [Streptomyces sp. ST2-7A]MCE7080829.1 YbjN domain-containing protein [Streptomyces sp. ST2-7A]
MSVDPSSIPNFGGRPPQSGQSGQSGQQGQQQGQPKKPVGPILPDQELVKRLLDQMKLKYVVDKEGDLVAPWEQFRTYFMFRGEKQQRIFSVRTFYDRQHTIEDKARLLETVNDWNRRTLWPKVYTHTHDDGSVRLIGEAQLLIGMGVALDQFISSTVSWVRASIEFDKWLVETLGLAKDADSAEEGTDSGEAGAEAADTGAAEGTAGDDGSSLDKGDADETGDGDKGPRAD